MAFDVEKIIKSTSVLTFGDERRSSYDPKNDEFVQAEIIGSTIGNCILYNFKLRF